MLKRIANRFILQPINRIQLKQKNVNIDIRASVDTISFFEGENIVAFNSILKNSSIGYGSYISSNSRLINCEIGRYTSIGPNVNIVLGQHPTSNYVSTHPAFFSTRPNGGITFISKQKYNEYRYIDKDTGLQVKIGNDVWIGDGVKIMESVTIGDGAVVAAGAIVTKDIPNYAIVAGVPAKILKYRFSVENREYLNNLKWWNQDIEWIKANAEYFDDLEKLKKRKRD